MQINQKRKLGNELMQKKTKWFFYIYIYLNAQYNYYMVCTKWA